MDWPIPSDGEIRTSAPLEPADAFTRPFIAGRSDVSEPLGIIIEENGRNDLAPARNRRKRQRNAAWMSAGAAGVLAIGSIAWLEHGASSPPSTTERLPAATPATAINLPPPNLLKPVSPQEAVADNADRPFVDRPDSPAARFMLRTDVADRDRAVNCLTQAVYYEAASEGPDGERAVAQVILNRLHHPGYPSTVCGVVYQGAERSTGCQFTFVCDGSLQRAPVAALWARSRKIAEEALAGKVFAAVGHATHYHADYVLPYWADVLDKSVQIGRHIFYRLRGPLGDARGFSQRYAGTEPLLPKPEASALLPADSTSGSAAATLIGAAVAAPQQVEKAAAPAASLAVDSAKGALIIDGGRAVTQRAAKNARQPVDCETQDAGSKLAPLGSVDMRSEKRTSC